MVSTSGTNTLSSSLVIEQSIDWCLMCTEKKLIPVTSDSMPARQIRAPMTKAEWEKQQSIVRRVHDPSTGRDRYDAIKYKIGHIY